MKTTVVSLALVIVFCGLAMPRSPLHRPRGQAPKWPLLWRAGLEVADPEWVSRVPGNGGKTQP